MRPDNEVIPGTPRVVTPSCQTICSAKKLVDDLVFYLEECHEKKNVLEATYIFGNKLPYHSPESIAYGKDVSSVIERAKQWLLTVQL